MKLAGRAAALALLVAGLLAFRMFLRRRAAADFVVQRVTTPFKRVLGALCGLVPFSVAEVCWVLLILFCAFYLVHAAVCMVRGKGQRLRVLVQKLLGACIVAAAVYLGYCLLWGVNYYAVTFGEQAGLADAPISVEQLASVTGLFAWKVNVDDTAIRRDANGLFTADREALFARSADIYAGVEKVYPFLAVPHHPAKPLVFSQLMSEINYTGFYFPFTGEANVNTLQPVCFLPSTLAHEQAHLRNIAPEQAANFVAVLACELSDDAEYRYSGDLMAYLHLSNALYGADPAAFRAVEKTLCAGAKADLHANNAYWDQYSTPAAAAANTVYEGFLQSYDQHLGMKSYGAVVDLLVAYFGDEVRDA